MGRSSLITPSVIPAGSKWDGGTQYPPDKNVMPEEKDISVPGPTFEEIQARSGIEEGAEKPFQETEPGTEKQPESKSEAKSEKEPKHEAKEAASEEDHDDGENEDDDDGSDKGEEEKDGKSKPSEPPAKNRSPLKAVFSRVKGIEQGQKEVLGAVTELAKVIAELKKPASTEAKAATETVEDALATLLKEAEGKEGDSDFLKRFGETLIKKVKADLEKDGLVRKDLPPEILEAIRKIEKLDTEKVVETKREAILMKLDEEVSSFLPNLKKVYPNASEEMLGEAKELLSELAVSKEYGGESADGTDNKGKQPMPLDYILFKEKAKFDSLLKVAPKSRSGEKGGNEPDRETDEGTSDDIDLNPETMSPDKFKKYQNRKLNEKSVEDVRIVRPL